MDIQAAKQAVIAEHGPWTAHDIDLGQGVYTVKDGRSQAWRIQMVDRLFADFGYTDFRGLRILDLACLEGLFAIEYARRGAETVGIEIRTQHLAKATFARDALGLNNCSFVQDDVRNLSLQYGRFDIVICAGILYHLDFPDCITQLAKIKAVCKVVALIDTHIAPPKGHTWPDGLAQLSDDLHTLSFQGQDYEGRFAQEHSETDSPEEKLHAPWASADNPRSFWLTESSLRTAIEQSGMSVKKWECTGGRLKIYRPWILASSV